VTLDGYKFFFVIPISIIVIVFVTTGILFLKLFASLPDYDLSIDTRINT